MTLKKVSTLHVQQVLSLFKHCNKFFIYFLAFAVSHLLIKNNMWLFIYIYIYIYIHILNNSPYSEKTQKVIWSWKYTMNHCQGEKYIYIGKKRKGPPCHTNWKKSKDTQLVSQKKKTTVRATKLQCKMCSILSRAK